MTDYQMYQCTVEKQTEAGVLRKVTWLPAEFAELGRVLKLKDNELWSNGWTVTHVGPYPMPSSQVNIRSRDYLKTRQHSDITRSKK